MNESQPFPDSRPGSTENVPFDENLLEKTVPSSMGKPPGTGGVSTPVSTAMPREDLAADMLIRGVTRVAINGCEAPVLGGVALLAKLGQGGMGKVYFGFHLRLEKEVAVKIVWADMAERIPELIPRFKREAKLAAKVHSPHLVAVLDVDAACGLHYMVMDYVHGLPAAKYLRQIKQAGRAGLLESEALEICIASTKGLAAAHAKNIIHRDVKPDNILVPCNEQSGEMYFDASKLADLGIARQESSADSQLTGAQQFMGTPGFAAPEQAEDAASCGKPADVFSMGATLYALLAGKEPFSTRSGNSGEERMSQVVLAVKNNPHVPMRELRADVTPATAALLDRCLQKKPEQRFQDAKELLAALENARAILHGGEGSAPVIDAVKKTPPIIDTIEKTVIPDPRFATNARDGTAPCPSPTQPLTDSRRQDELNYIRGLRDRAKPVGDRQDDKQKKRNPLLIPAAVAALFLVAGGILASYASSGSLFALFNKPSEKKDPTNPATTNPSTMVTETTVKAQTQDKLPLLEKPKLPDKPPEIEKPPLPLPPKPAVPEKPALPEKPPEKLPAPNVPPPVVEKPKKPEPVVEKPKAPEQPEVNPLVLDLGNNVKIELVKIPAGTFKMGSPETEEGRDEFETQHDVKIGKAFLMAKTEVTQEQYEAVMGDNPSEFKGKTLPVENVSWFNASAFCEKLRAKIKRNVQLPTEAQWEYACRAGTTTAFNTGETIATDQANYDGDSKYGRGVPGENRRKTTAVGSFKPNAFGLFDMHGNVLEWCQDWFAENYYTNAEATDPVGPDTGATRAARGGSWSLVPRNSRSAYRYSKAPNYRHDNLGFRVVVTE